jgi:hypothetical protein
MTIHDYNGSGRWSAEAIRARYLELARRFRIAEPSDLRPKETTCAEDRWIYPVMECVIEGIARGDCACSELGVEFIQESGSFPFGRMLKAKTARALRRAVLSPYQQESIRKRVVEMLIAGYMPPEYREYAKLAWKIGLGHWWVEAKDRVNLANKYMRRYYDYFERHAGEDKASGR